MPDLISQAAAKDFEARAVMPARELGAYEALWAREGASFQIPGGVVPQPAGFGYLRTFPLAQRLRSTRASPSALFETLESSTSESACTGGGVPHEVARC